MARGRAQAGQCQGNLNLIVRLGPPVKSGFVHPDKEQLIGGQDLMQTGGHLLEDPEAARLRRGPRKQWRPARSGRSENGRKEKLVAAEKIGGTNRVALHLRLVQKEKRGLLGAGSGTRGPGHRSPPRRWRTGRSVDAVVHIPAHIPQGANIARVRIPPLENRALPTIAMTISSMVRESMPRSFAQARRVGAQGDMFARFEFQVALDNPVNAPR